MKRYDLSHVQLITSGAAPFSAELLAPLSKVFPNAEIGQGYVRFTRFPPPSFSCRCSGDDRICNCRKRGKHKTSFNFLYQSCLQWPISQRYGIPGSAGQLLPGYQAKVIKPDGSLGKPGEEGELYVKSPSLALGYYGDPKA